MSLLNLIELLILCVVIAWMYLRICADVIAGPVRFTRGERERMRGWWYYDGWRWHREERDDAGA